MQHNLSVQQLPANPVATFFRTTNLVLTAYDIRRGHCEGEEAEKVLSFFPTSAPIHVRTSIVGLAQAVASFAGTLSQDESDFKIMVGEQLKWVMFRCEPSIWLLAVVRKSWAGGTCTNAAFKSLLVSLYNVFVLLHGRMNTLLEQDPTGFALRRVLQPVLDEVGWRLLRPEAAASRGPGGLAGLLANPLAPHCPGAVPLLATSHATFLAVQCLVSQLLVASFYGSRLVGGVVVLWGGLPVWSTVGAEDTAALVTLAARALGPAARAAQKSRPVGSGSVAFAAGVSTITGAVTGGGGLAASPGEIAFETLLSPLQWRAGGGFTSSTPTAPTSTLTAMATNMGFAFTSATAAAGPVGSGSTSGACVAPMFGPSTPGGISLAGILGFGVGAASAASASAGGGGSAPPPLPVSSSAAAGPSSSSSTSGGTVVAGCGFGGGSGGLGVEAAAVASGSGGVCSPPFLSSFLRPRLRPALYSCCTGGALPLESVLPMTQVWLQGSNEWAQLLPYHRGQLLVLALLHDGPAPGLEVLAALAAVLGRGSGPAAAALAAEVPARSVWHVKGHRYCFSDPLLHVTRYSPLKKVLTLSNTALRQLAHLRSKMDEWEGGAAGCRGGGGRGSGQGGSQYPCRPQQQALLERRQLEEGEAALAGTGGANTATSTSAAHQCTAGGSIICVGDEDGGVSSSCSRFPPLSRDCELVVRTAHDAVLVLRSAAGGRRLYAASEQSLAEMTLAQGTDPTLAAAVASTDVLCDMLFSGVFLQP